MYTNILIVEHISKHFKTISFFATKKRVQCTGCQIKLHRASIGRPHLSSWSGSSNLNVHCILCQQKAHKQQYLIANHNHVILIKLNYSSFLQNSNCLRKRKQGGRSLWESGNVIKGMIESKGGQRSNKGDFVWQMDCSWNWISQKATVFSSMMIALFSTRYQG